jgi:hypothetical protein
VTVWSDPLCNATQSWNTATLETWTKLEARPPHCQTLTTQTLTTQAAGCVDCRPRCMQPTTAGKQAVFCQIAVWALHVITTVLGPHDCHARIRQIHAPSYPFVTERVLMPGCIGLQEFRCTSCSAAGSHDVQNIFSLNHLAG